MTSEQEVLCIKEKATAMFLAVLLIGVSAVLLSTEKVQAAGTIYIKSDGTIDPPGAPINHDGSIYTFTGNIYESIVVQRDNIIVDGNDYLLQGPGSGIGFNLTDRNHVTIKKTHITQFDTGIYLYRSNVNTISYNTLRDNIQPAIFVSNSSNNIISKNEVVNNVREGIFLWNSNTTTVTENNSSRNGRDGISVGLKTFYNTITSNAVHNNSEDGISLGYEISRGNIVAGNNITGNLVAGIYVDNSVDNTFYHNNILNNTQQVNVVLTANLWDDGYLSGGNFWSDYTGSDLDGDGIGDTPYIIDADNQDNYPFMNPWTPKAYDVTIADVEPSKTFVGQGYDVRINVTVTNQGSYTQTFNVAICANQTIIGTRALTLSSQSSETLTFTWNTAGVTKGFYTLNATADQIPGEIDTLDNTHKNGNIKITIAGDVNGDAIVNVHDLFLIGKAYGSTQPNTNWNSNCDINEDNTVSQPDLEIARSDYSKTA